MGDAVTCNVSIRKNWTDWSTILGLGRAVGETIAVTMRECELCGRPSPEASLDVLFKERSIKCSFFLRVQLLIAPSLTLSMRVTSTCATMLMHIAIPKSTNPTPIIAGRCNEAGEASNKFVGNNARHCLSWSKE